MPPCYSGERALSRKLRGDGVEPRRPTVLASSFFAAAGGRPDHPIDRFEPNSAI